MGGIHAYDEGNSRCFSEISQPLMLSITMLHSRRCQGNFMIGLINLIVDLESLCSIENLDKWAAAIFSDGNLYSNHSMSGDSAKFNSSVFGTSGVATPVSGSQ